MFRFVLGLAFSFTFVGPAFAKPSAETSLLTLCDSFGETRKECRCYFDEVRDIYTPADIELAGGVARAFMNGEEPEAIAAYVLLTRKITISRANELYTLGDKHARRVGKMCEDPSQKETPEIKAKRKAMSQRLEEISARYRIGS